MHQQWHRSSNFGTYKHWIVAPYADFNNLCLISGNWSQMNENPKSIKWRRVIKHKLRTFIASLQLKLNKVKKTPLNLMSSCFFIPIYRFFGLNRFKDVNAWLLFNFKWLLVQPYRGKNILICLWDGAVRFVLDQPR